MCYGSNCGYESSDGSCKLPRGEECPDLSSLPPSDEDSYDWKELYRELYGPDYLDQILVELNPIPEATNEN